MSVENPTCVQMQNDGVAEGALIARGERCHLASLAARQFIVGHATCANAFAVRGAVFVVRAGARLRICTQQKHARTGDSFVTSQDTASAAGVAPGSSVAASGAAGSPGRSAGSLE